MVDCKIFSADSHVSEPGDLWVQRLDKEFQFRAPRIERRERHGKLQDFWVYEGFPPHPVGVGLGAAAYSRGGPLFREGERGYGDALPGGWDPAERIKDQDVDGVDGEIVHTTLGFRLFWLRDPGLQRACFRVYNDWLAEYCSYSPRRLVGVPLISLYDVEDAVGELRRAQAMGLRGAMVWLSPPVPCPDYASRSYDPFWAAAEEMDMPVVLHTITGGAESRLSLSSYWDESNIVGAITGPHEAQRSLAQFIFSGVLERFPELRVQSAENGTDWIPWFVGRLKRSTRRTNSFPTSLSLTPIEYFNRQVYFSYIDEPQAVGYRDLIGDNHLMFATDYPHTASTFPKSQEIVERDTGALPAELRQKIVHDNALKLFNLPAPVPA
jgi:predicted TIM-barrel fold metal-dependent hydrolase